MYPIILLQQAASQAAPQGGMGSAATMWIMLLLIFVVMYFFMIKPQRKQQKELEDFRSSLKKGDKVITAGGIYGTVDEIKDDSVLLKIDGETKMRVAKGAINRTYSDAQQQ